MNSLLGKHFCNIQIRYKENDTHTDAHTENDFFLTGSQFLKHDSMLYASCLGEEFSEK